MARDPALRDDANEGGEYEGRNGPLKKGPWTIDEDMILHEYVLKYGEGNWSAVQRYTSLARCGKSCRLRWVNHLRANLKKGMFTEEEERIVVRLHAKMGNKWAKMAKELPGRTDNEIKNFWNTRKKRRQRDGLPLYPPDVVPEHGNDLTAPKTFYPTNSFLLTPPKPFCPTNSSALTNRKPFGPTNSFLLTAPKPFCPTNYFPLTNPKGMKGSADLFPFNAASGSFQPKGSQYQTAQPFTMGSSAYNIPQLPPIQKERGGWGSLASLDSVNILTQTQKSEQDRSCGLSPRKSGLLEEVVYESKNLKNSNNASVIAPADVFDISYETEWAKDDFLLTPPVEILDEHQPIDTDQEGRFEPTPTNFLPMQTVNEAETSNKSLFPQSDMLLDANFFGGSTHTTATDDMMLENATLDDLKLDNVMFEDEMLEDLKLEDMFFDHAMFDDAIGSAFEDVWSFDDFPTPSEDHETEDAAWDAVLSAYSV